jgi:ubiquinone/menaquinone biosynthesis C-methylase UbiE
MFWMAKNSEYIYNDFLFFEDQLKSNNFCSHLNLSLIRRFFRNHGGFFLDVGCGAKAYTTLARGFNFHVCLDFAKTGLREAKTKVTNGLFVLADLTKLPFKTSAFSGAIAMHILYHIPKEHQKNCTGRIGESHRESLSHCLWQPRKFHFSFQIHASKTEATKT